VKGAAFRTRFLVLGPAAELARAGDASALDYLRAALKSDEDPHVRARAAEVSARVPALTAELAAAAGDPEVRVREAAVTAIKRIAAEDARVDKVCIWANDKDLAQCVRDDRVVQIIRKGMQIRNAEAVRAKFGVEPELIPDLLALVGDAQDGYPGIRGIGPSTAAALLNRHGPIEFFPDGVLGAERERALLFKTLATLRTDAPLFADVDELEWRGPTPAFAEWPQRMGDERIQARCEKAGAARSAM